MGGSEMTKTKLKHMKLFVCICVCAWGLAAQAQETVPAADPHVWQAWKEDIESTRWETGATLAGVTVLGLYSWDWGSSKRFRWNPEGWFGENTGSGGADKLGHAFTSYTMTNVLADRLIRQGRSPERSALSAALTTQAIMMYVELFDAYSDDHGFSREDVAMNLLGTGLAYARLVRPELRDRLDFRMAYSPSDLKGFKPLSDYEGQKYLMALKLGGFDGLRNTPLRFIEIHAGYYARGFSASARARGDDRTRSSYFGLGLNLNELLWGHKETVEGELNQATRLFFEHVQVPPTAPLREWRQ